MGMGKIAIDVEKNNIVDKVKPNPTSLLYEWLEKIACTKQTYLVYTQPSPNQDW